LQFQDKLTSKIFKLIRMVESSMSFQAIARDFVLRNFVEETPRFARGDKKKKARGGRKRLRVDRKGGLKVTEKLLGEQPLTPT
jgi:hypothetical protein